MRRVASAPGSLNAMQLAVSPNNSYIPEHWVARFKIVEALAQHGASVNVRAPFGTGMASPLYILYENLTTHKVLRVLIQYGAKVDDRDDNKMSTPLMLAVTMQDPEGAKILLDAGADVNAHATMYTDDTPLSLTKQTRKDGSVIIDTQTRDILLKAGAKE
jgi:ankyrin repeat protein